MLRIQCESMLGRAPIFETLGKTVVLADSVIAAAYRIALARSAAAAEPRLQPGDQMMVIALGRLGMREFDLGTDADLNLRDSRRGRRRAGLLDRRGRAHDPDAQLLHRRRRDVRRRYAPAAQRPRGRPGADRGRLQETTSPSTPRPGKASPT